MIKDRFGNSRIFDHPNSARFIFPTWKVIQSVSGNKGLKVGFEFRGEFNATSGRYHVVDERYQRLDGYSYDCVCEKISDPDSFTEYFQSIEDPDSLRADYKEVYYRIKSK